MPAQQSQASEPYAALKQNIRFVVLNTIDRHNERVQIPTPRHINANLNANLAAEIADVVVTRVLELEKKPKEWDAAAAMLEVFISRAQTEEICGRDAAISFFRGIMLHLAEAALAAPAP